jgi:hypothetical protein
MPFRGGRQAPGFPTVIWQEPLSLTSLPPLTYTNISPAQEGRAWATSFATNKSF